MIKNISITSRVTYNKNVKFVYASIATSFMQILLLLQSLAKCSCFHTELNCQQTNGNTGKAGLAKSLPQ